MTYISHENSFLEVHLSRIVNTHEKYFVELKKNNKQLVSFHMKADALDRWIVTKPVPIWVSRLVPELTSAIQNHRRFFN